MASELFTERTVVNRLRIHGSAASRGVATTLATADLRPRGLPRSAVLCVRRLHAPRYAAATSGTASTPWEAQLRDALDRLARTAARPGLGPVPAGAEAVVFADWGELLACFARDWLKGAAAQHWWWESLFRGHVGAGFLRTCRDHLPYFPAALSHLADWGQAPALVEALTPDETAVLLHELAATFDIPAVAAAVTGSIPNERGGPPMRPDVPGASYTPDATGVGREHEEAEAVGRVAPPWAGRIPEIQGTRLTWPRECLLATGLLLHRDPARVRSARFAEDIAQWRREIDCEQTASPGATGTPPPESLRTAIVPTVQERRDSPRAPVPGPINEVATAVSGEPAPPVAPSGEGRDAASAVEAAGTRPGARQTSENTHAIETDLGGVFYLVNVLLRLELYGDFTRPRHRAVSIPFWDCLELLARRLLADPSPDDAVWRVIADLAGRDPVVPAGIESESGSAWLDELVAQADPWIRAALALEDDNAPVWLIRRGAAVETALAQVHVRFRLDELPIELRLSGLDRDPGWVPAAGRAVAFHYD